VSSPGRELNPDRARAWNYGARDARRQIELDDQRRL
jgi:hypothetical protein